MQAVRPQFDRRY